MRNMYIKLINVNCTKCSEGVFNNRFLHKSIPFSGYYWYQQWNYAKYWIQQFGWNFKWNSWNWENKKNNDTNKATDTSLESPESTNKSKKKVVLIMKLRQLMNPTMLLRFQGKFMILVKILALTKQLIHHWKVLRPLILMV